MTDIDFRLFDADNHFYEPDDSFSRHIEAKWKDRAVHSELGSDGQLHTIVSGKVAPFFESVKPAGQQDWVGRPGSRKEFLHKMKSGEPQDMLKLYEPVRDVFLDRDKRLALMDEQGIEACLMFPGHAVGVEYFFTDTDELYANYRAWNRWLEEDWGFAYQDRIFSPAFVSLRDLDQAVAQVEWLIEHGVKVIAFPPGPAYGRSPADTYFDPVWARINEAGVAVAYHLSESGYTRSVSALWGENPDPPNFEMSAWQWMNTYEDRPVMDTISALLFGNLFARFPRLRVAIVENGAGWLPYFLSMIDKARGLGRNGPWRGGQMPERPTAVFRRHFVVTPFPEDDVASIIDAVGPEVIALGSDYPHPEGLAEPREFQKLIDHLPADQQRLVLRDNGMRFVRG